MINYVNLVIFVSVMFAPTLIFYFRMNERMKMCFMFHLTHYWVIMG